jgi:hypothetical protein
LLLWFSSSVEGPWRGLFHHIDYILSHRRYHQLLWYLVFQGWQHALSSLRDQLRTVSVWPVKQVPMDHLCNRHCWGQQSWAHSRPPQHLFAVWPNETERLGLVYWNHSALPIYHLWHHSMSYFSMFSNLRPQYEHHCSKTQSSCPLRLYKIDIH